MTLAPLPSWESGGAIKSKGGRGHGKRARKGKKVGEKEKRGEGQWVKKEGGGRGKERERETTVDDREGGAFAVCAK